MPEMPLPNPLEVSNAKCEHFTPRCWYEADHMRLVQECRALQSEYPDFTLSLSDGQLVWEGQVFAPWPGEEGQGEPYGLKIRLTYPHGFPAAAIKVMPLAPELPLHLWGHKWHRWGDGSLCLGHPDRWDISYTARDVIEKAAEWWFNFLVFLFERIDQMPDVGRAVLGARYPTETSPS